MSGIMDGVEKIMDAYRNPFMYPHLSEEDMRMMQHCYEALQQSDFYEIERPMSEYVHNQNQDSFAGMMLDEIRAPMDARPPSDICCMYFPNSEMGIITLKHEAGVRKETPHPTVSVLRVGQEIAPFGCGCYAITDKEEQNEIFLTRRYLEGETSSLMLNIIMTTAVLFSLINQPRFVVRGKTGTRQRRKHLYRGHGVSLDAWNKIVWNVGEPVKAKDDNTKGGWRMPLHYTRGHWRKAHDHWEDVVIRKDGKPYKWIDGFWSGHPAYGVKKSYHAPKLGKSYENV